MQSLSLSQSYFKSLPDPSLTPMPIQVPFLSPSLSQSCFKSLPHPSLTPIPIQVLFLSPSLSLPSESHPCPHHCLTPNLTQIPCSLTLLS